MEIGRQGEYFWLQFLEGSAIVALSNVPSLFETHRVIISNWDHDLPELTIRELVSDFSRQGNVIVCPFGAEIHDIPNGGSNEWYLFAGRIPLEVQDIQTYADYGLFHFKTDQRIADLQTKFWEQLLRLNADVYLCDKGINLIATKNADIFERVHDWITSRYH